MFTIYDFINQDIDSDQPRFGWASEAFKLEDGIGATRIALRYTRLNFGWKSLELIGNDQWNMFLPSKPYAKMMEKLEQAAEYGRTYFEAYSVEDLKLETEKAGLDLDVDGALNQDQSK